MEITLAGLIKLCESPEIRAEFKRSKPCIGQRKQVIQEKGRFSKILRRYVRLDELQRRLGAFINKELDGCGSIRRNGVTRVVALM